MQWVSDLRSTANSAITFITGSGSKNHADQDEDDPEWTGEIEIIANQEEDTIKAALKAIGVHVIYTLHS